MNVIDKIYIVKQCVKKVAYSCEPTENDQPCFELIAQLQLNCVALSFSSSTSKQLCLAKKHTTCFDNSL